MPEADAEGFEAATSHYRPELFAHCCRMTGSVQDAEDLVQDIYAPAHRVRSGGFLQPTDTPGRQGYRCGLLVDQAGMASLAMTGDQLRPTRPRVGKSR
jgi:Sigma-70 region 2